MRKFVAVIVFATFLFSLPGRANAIVFVPVLVAAGAIGAVMLATSAATYYAQTGQYPQWVKSTANAVASANDAMMMPTYLAYYAGKFYVDQALTNMQDFYAAVPSAVGGYLGDLWNTVKDSADAGFQPFKDWFKQFIPASTWDSPLATATSGTSFQLSNGTYITLTSAPKLYITYPDVSASIILSYTTGYGFVEQVGDSYLVIGKSGVTGIYIHSTGLNSCECYSFNITTTTSEPDSYIPLVTGIPAYPAAAAAYPNTSSDVKNAVKDAIAALPDSKKITAGAVPDTLDTATAAPAPVTAAQLKSLLAAQTASVAQAVADAAAATAAADPTDTAAQTAAAQAALAAQQAAAQAAEAAKEAEDDTSDDTYDSITNTAFAEPYKPSDYDIPTRFNTFLTAVKSSSLFGFSSSFFDSLPSGGSPIITIEGGNTFGGTHTIDLSETLAAGLAVCKAVLFAIFGFLSIRAIIMKR